MPGQPQSKPQSAEADPDSLTRLGGWLFKYRTSIPLPIVFVLLLIPGDPALSTSVLWLGVLVVLAGEWIRLVAVHQIGAISRTRSERLGPLIDTGPFGVVRNPLYLGNILLWLGFTLCAGLPWLAPLVAAVLAFEYHAIVRWEETLLEARLGAAYRAYQARVPRWMPRFGAPRSEKVAAAFSWRQTLFSERGTLIAIVAGFLLLWWKAEMFK